MDKSKLVRDVCIVMVATTFVVVAAYAIYRYKKDGRLNISGQAIRINVNGGAPGEQAQPAKLEVVQVPFSPPSAPDDPPESPAGPSEPVIPEPEEGSA